MDRRIGPFALILVACRPSAEVPTVEEQTPGNAAAPKTGVISGVVKAATVHMSSHFIDVLDVHQALIRGALPEAQAAAAHLEHERPDVMLAEWAPYLLGTAGAAQRVRQAKTLAEAGPAAAALARSCGDCHSALGVKLRPTVPLGAPPTGADGAAMMRRHAWAFNRLWEGLVFPSDASWERGAAAFADLPPCEDTPSPEQDLSAISKAREDSRAFEADARAATNADARVEVYGRMLGTCAACHAGGC